MAKEVKLEQGHAAFKDNVMRNSKKLHLAIFVNAVSFKAMTILKNEYVVKPLGLTGTHGQGAL